jgi:hypothetical protein
MFGIRRGRSGLLRGSESPQTEGSTDGVEVNEEANFGEVGAFLGSVESVSQMPMERSHFCTVSIGHGFRCRQKS